MALSLALREETSKSIPVIPNDCIEKIQQKIALLWRKT